VQCPTLVFHRAGDRDSNVEEGRFIAERIPGARFVELPGDTHAPWVDMDEMLDEVEEFLTGTRPTPIGDRLLATLLFTDIVGSTDRLAQVGDAAWTSLLDRHHATVRQELALFGGVEADTAGDGFLALFDGPARAVRAGLAIRNALRRIGLDIRVGVHTGEIEQAADGPRGIAVHLAARVLAAADPGEVLVSSTTHDLVEGSGLEFEDRGEHELKGIAGARHLYAAC
jgi:class 3 adenylate cyclase